MLLLPIVTRPFSLQLVRVHQPSEGSYDRAYTRFRECLSWEFGFTCAFCLLHQSDIMEESRGSGAMTTEHLEAQSAVDGKSLQNHYSNVVNACRWCNRARGAEPLLLNGIGLHNPVQQVWSEHFFMEGMYLRARENDPAAARTEAVYDLNDQRKVKARELRSKRLTRIYEFLSDYPALCEQLEELVAEERVAPRNDLKQKIFLLRRSIEAHLDETRDHIRRYCAIPEHVLLKCGCRLRHLELPPALAVQCLEAPVLPEVCAKG